MLVMPRQFSRRLAALVPGCCLPFAGAGAATADRPNILFIAADDLRADLGCYGSKEARTPQLDALARRGVVFERAYCQQAVCNPSRASVLTGRRPDTLKVWDLRTHFRETLPEVVTLPQHFKQHGYTAVGIGKLFHNESGAKPRFPFADRPSWSEPPIYATGPHWRDWVVPGDPSGPKEKGGPIQCLDVLDDAYLDGRIAAAAVARLGELKTAGQPFFLGVGFWKPHLPFNAPKRYWDLYDRGRLSQPEPREAPWGAPAIAGHPWNELRNYAGMPAEGPLTSEQVAELLDLYPTLVDLAGLPPASGLEGVTLVPWLRDPHRPGKDLAVSQHPHPSYGKATHMGYTLRTPRLRYVEWRDLPTGAVTAQELYDHEKDPRETLNLVGDPSYTASLTDLTHRAAVIAAASGRWPALR